MDNRWWFLDPDGHPFLSKGVCHITSRGDTIPSTGAAPYQQAVERQHGGVQQWRQVTAERLMGLGFNTLGAWSDEALAGIEVQGRHLAFAPTIDLGSDYVSRELRQAAWLKGVFPDVFDPKFKTLSFDRAARVCGPQKNNRNVLGWFTDNELKWGPDWRGKDELLTAFLNYPSHQPGRKSALDFLQRRHPTIEEFNRVWKTTFTSWNNLSAAKEIKQPYARREVYSQNEGDERQANEADSGRAAFVADCEGFLGLIAEQYFQITRAAIQAADPNHLVFGSRFAYVPAKPVVEAAAKYLDAVSFNCYNTDPRSVIRKYAAFGKPLIIGEFTFRARDSGLPNSKGAGPTVATQQDRADGFENYVRQGLSLPELVGYHWFQYTDQPKEGRFDGENSNYGVVDIQDNLYPVLTQTMKESNAQAEAWHRQP
jgi:agarase